MSTPNGTTNGRTPLLEIKGIHVSVEDKEIVHGIDLVIYPGEVHAIMGENGSGKSTLANALMGHPKYKVTAGQALLDGEDILGLTPDARARAGLFLSFQNPMAIPGVGTGNFLRAAVKAVRGESMNAVAFRKELTGEMAALRMDQSFATRALNEGFSGGEKKRAETLQMAMLKPKLAILDEPDSGLDIDAVRIVSEGVNRVLEGNAHMGVLLITHYKRILNYVKPGRVHVMVGGRIVESGGPELADRLEVEGYEPIRERLGIGLEDGKVTNGSR